MNRPTTDLLTQYLAGTCTDDERRQVETWYDSFDHNPASTDGPPEFSDAGFQTSLFDQIQAAIRETEPVMVPFRPNRQRWHYAVAASVTGVCLLAGIWWFRLSPHSTQVAQTSHPHVSAPGEVGVVNTQSKIVRYALPDGSIVWLNPRAKISHPVRFTGQNRMVSFAGEGFFSVRRNVNQPFVIRSGRMTTEVLGTTFNVRANPVSQHYEVAVVTGRVAVSIETNARKPVNRVLLKPRQQASVNVETAAIKTRTSPENAKPALYEPISIAFDWIPLDEVARRLEAVYDVDIQLPNPALRQCRLQADFTNQRLPAIMELLSKSVGASYTIDGNRITLTGAGCPSESTQ